jgi:hypothetical protein
MIAIALAAHGIAHAVGFAVSWRLIESVEAPYHTTLLNRRLDIGGSGIRVVGVLWVVAGLGFVASGLLLAAGRDKALMVLAATTLMSLALCALEWPFARIGLAIDAVILVALPALGLWLWRGDSQIATRSLEASASRQRPPVVEQTHDLPLPVRRYFSRVLAADQRAITFAALDQEAEFYVGGAWRPLRATQSFSVAPAGFVWDARIYVLPLMPVLVRDSYINGRGSMRANFLGAYPMVHADGSSELDSGALHRYLAEAVWIPTALLPSAGVRWSAVGDDAAIATLRDDRSTVSMEFRFNRDGDVAELFTPARFAENHGRYEPRPWLVRCFDYESHAGMRIPARCEVEWQLATGSVPYWRGRITAARYRFADVIPAPALPAGGVAHDVPERNHTERNAEQPGNHVTQCSTSPGVRAKIQPRHAARFNARVLSRRADARPDAAVPRDRR